MGQEMEKKNEEYGFYSRKTKKVYNSLSELKAAEKEIEDKQSKEIQLSENRKKDAKKVEDAYKYYIKTVSDSNVAVKKAKDNYLSLRKDFIKNYGYYHMTYDNSSNNEAAVTVYDDFIDMWKNFWLF